MALWTPAQLGGDLAMWFDADDSGTITLNGSTVSQWDDKSGNARHATQSTASSQPTYTPGALNGKPVLTFNSDFLDHPLSLTGESTIFAVANKTVTNADQAIIAISDSGVAVDNAIWSQIATGTDEWGVYTNTFTGSGETIGTSHRIVGTISKTPTSGPIEMYTDGELSASASGGRWNGSDFRDRRRIGSENPGSLRYHRGDIAEILVASRALPDYEREKVEGYLAHKWGLTANLPSGHPYKSAAPTVDDPRAVTDWTPANITGLWSWHDWSTDDYRIADNKGNMSGWQDRSANNHDLVLKTISLGAADMAATTINGVQAYGSTNGQQGWTVDKLSTELDTDFLLVGMVAKMPASGSNDFFVSARDDAGVAWQISNPNSSLLTAGLAATGTFKTYTIGTGNAFILVVRYDLRVSGTTPLAPAGFMVRSRLNGQLTDDRDAHTISSYAPSNVRVGIGCQPAAPNIVSCPINAAFGEVVIASRNTEFTVADVQRLEGYLAWKWGGL